MRQCVAYIYDSSMTYIFDLMVKFIGLLTWLHVQPVTDHCFEIGISYLAHEFITMRHCVVYIHDPSMKLIFYPEVKFTGVLT